MQDPRLLTSREFLGASLEHNGIPGMARTSAPEVPNMYSGPDAQVGMNHQPTSQNRLKEQSFKQNASTAVAGAQANAVQQTRRDQLVADNQAHRTQQVFTNYLQDVLSKTGGDAIMEIGSQTPIENKKFRTDVATQKAMTMGINPNLILNALEQNRHMA
tara:strand:- start:187 stop:663 length:477 start_codon:yes stop_codon:yes gene_type:complete